tara:strand:+ start:655 stop:849 length:195 start_codon:yes stop_codon:yes gene_type:complete
VVEPLLPQLLVVPQVVRPLLRRPRRKKRKRVRYSPRSWIFWTHILTCFAAKEESDEDMGFGLFD